MSYRRTLTTRWSRRDRLGVVVIALVLAFLTGSTVLVTAATVETTEIAGEFDVVGTAVPSEVDGQLVGSDAGSAASVASAGDGSGAGETILLVPVRVGNTSTTGGGTTTVLAAPAGGGNVSLDGDGVVFPHRGVTGGEAGWTDSSRSGADEATLRIYSTAGDGSGDVDGAGDGDGGDPISLQPATGSGVGTEGADLLPRHWLRANESVARALGPTAAYRIAPADGSGGGGGAGGVGAAVTGGGAGGAVPTDGVPLRGALAYFTLGMGSVLALVTATAAGAAVLAGVTVFSVTRMAVRDRATTIRVARATGATPRQLLGTFAGRGALLTGTGVALGYAVGVVATNAVANAAVYLGMPISLSTGVTATAASVLALGYLLTLGVGVGASLAAAWSACRGPPAAVGRGHHGAGSDRGGGGERSGAGDESVGGGEAPVVAGDGEVVAVDGGAWEALGDAVEVDGGFVTDIGEPVAVDDDDGGDTGDRVAEIGRSLRGGLATARGWLRPRLLDPRAAVPTAASLAVFVVLVVLVASGAGTMGLLLGGGSGSVGAGIAGAGVAGASGGEAAPSDVTTITEPGAGHPIASTVPAAYADVLADAPGVAAASPELLLFSAVDGRPVLTRGATYRRFAAVSDAHLVAGDAPARRGEAAIGADLAERLGVGVGDHLPIGGSTLPRFARVEVSGIFAAPGPADDQLVVGLETAHHLTGSEPGTVQIVRVRGDLGEGGAGDGPDAGGVTGAANGTGVVTVDASAPSRIVADRELRVSLSVFNPGGAAVDVERPVWIRRAAGDGDGHTATISGTVPAGERRTFAVRLRAPSAPGRYTVHVGNRSAGALAVEGPDTIRLGSLPERVPPGSEPQVRVLTADGGPVAGAVVSFDGETQDTDADGTVRVDVGAIPGTYTLSVANDGQTVTRNVTVTPGAPRAPVETTRVAPDAPTVLTAPVVSVRLDNPWNRLVTRTYRLSGPGLDRRVHVALPPGGDRRITAGLGQRPAGTYAVHLDRVGTSGGSPERVTSTRYTVRGDERLAGAVATLGRQSGGSSVARALQVLLGNVQVLVAAVLGLGALMTVGSVTAAFSQAVHARRRTLGIRRATGAGPAAVLRLVLGDALRVATLAVLPALALGYAALWALGRAGLLTVYGLEIDVAATPSLLGGMVAVAYGLVLVGSGLAGLWVLRRPPRALLAGDG